MSFGYDPEAFMQDADFEMAELQEAANRESRLRKRGICTHPSVVASGQDVTCYHCGKHFASMAEAHEARKEALL